MIALVTSMLINITSLVCFTLLAIHFEHWWIVLFAYFFMFNGNVKQSTHEVENDEEE